MSDSYFNETDKKALVTGWPVHEETPPPTPANTDQWLLHQAGAPSTKLEGSEPIYGGLGAFHVIVTSTLAADTGQFGDPGYGRYGFISFEPIELYNPDTQAWGFWDFPTNPQDGDVISLIEGIAIPADIYFKDTPVNPNDIQIGVGISHTVDNLMTYLNANFAPSSIVSTREAVDQVRITVGSNYQGANSNNKWRLTVAAGGRVATSHVSSDYCYEGANGTLIIYPVTITPTPPGTYAMIISYSIDKTYNDIVTALNAWAVANLSAGVAPICNLTNPADGSIVPLGITVYLTSDLVPEQLNFNLQLASGRFDGQFNGPV